MKNGCVMNTDYIRFGSGKKTLLILPGLGDGLRTVKGTALPLSYMYRSLSSDYTVYAFSRRNDMRPDSSTRDMAADLAAAMASLGIQKADVMGVSMGGMIAQWLAIDHPQLVDKLILVVTAGIANEILKESVQEWLSCIERNDHRALMDSNLKRIYSNDYYRKNKWMIPLIGRITKPRSYERFNILAKACITHNAMPYLSQITASTLVIGGERDIALGVDASRQIFAEITGAKLKIYPQWGHGLYEEEPDFLKTVLSFLRGNAG